MPQRKLYLAAYDVADPDRLREVMLLVRGYATGGQLSVYECYLTAGERADLLAAVRDVLHPRQDRFFLLRLDPRSRVRALGRGLVPRDPSYFYAG
ncbi:MAG TPA: CRISPR-associated endonuclease Cas2 [Candidatus Acidoferrales bacterium]|nr:CRISPR-associated endonuclease Cas2 [Candidatus Acidoferrales bacterium]